MEKEDGDAKGILNTVMRWKGKKGRVSPEAHRPFEKSEGGRSRWTMSGEYCWGGLEATLTC